MILTYSFGEKETGKDENDCDWNLNGMLIEKAWYVSYFF